MNNKNPRFSFCISSSGRQRLLEDCISSIHKLDLDSYEVLVGSSKNIRLKITDHFSILKTESHVGKTRNQLKSNARGDLLVFIDEDIQILDNEFIKKVEEFAKQDLADVYGGFYQSHKGQSMIDRAYNMTCNLWVQRGEKSSPHVLGGIYILKGNKFPDYFDAYSFGGEEYPYFNELSKHKYKIHVTDQISVSHTPSHSLKTFFKRAWLHGKFKPIDKVKGKRMSLFFKYQEQIHIKFIAGLYFVVVYISQFFNKFKNSFLLLFRNEVLN